jgi:hypothetical protein
MCRSQYERNGVGLMLGVSMTVWPRTVRVSRTPLFDSPLLSMEVPERLVLVDQPRYVFGSPSLAKRSRWPIMEKGVADAAWQLV